MSIFGLIIATALLRVLAAQTVEVQRVQFGATVSLDCDLTSSSVTAWLRQNPHGPPTLVVLASLRKGDAIYAYRVEPRFTVEFANRSLTLTITDVNETDLGMYFCLVFVNTELLVGSGAVLEGPFRFGFYQWYCTVVSGGLLSMVICVCVIHRQTKGHRHTALRDQPKDEKHRNIYAVQVQEQMQATSCDSDLSDYVYNIQI